MKLLRYGPPGAEKPALLRTDGTIRCLASVVRDIDGFALSDAALKMIGGVDPNSLPKVDPDAAAGSLRGAAGELRLHRAELRRSRGGGGHAGAEGTDHLPEVAGRDVRTE